MGQRKIIDNAGPESILYMKCIGRQPRDFFQLQQGDGRQNQRPHFPQIVFAQTKCIHHALDIHRVGGIGGCFGHAKGGHFMRTANALPEGRVVLHIQKQGAGQLCQRIAQFNAIGAGRTAHSQLDLADFQILIGGDRRQPG